MKVVVQSAWALLGLVAAAWPQTTEGVITGRLYDVATGAGLPNGVVVWRNETTGEGDTANGAADGGFSVQRVSPGRYWLRFLVCAARQPVSGGCSTNFRPREAYELEVHVAGRLELEVPMRKVSDTWDDGSYADAFVPAGDPIIRVYTADFASARSEPVNLLLGRNGTLFSTLSYVVNPTDVRELPLSGRDVYTMLVSLPGVTADNATARGLGLSINGQRSSSSNFLLDGSENNDRLVTGPATILPPEMVEEYRVSTNNYSAEFGRTGGFVANAITRAGGNVLHGVAYGYLNDSVWNANSYQHKQGLNTSTGQFGPGLPRQPQTTVQAGVWTGGPLVRDRAFWSAGYDRLRSRSESDPFPYEVPVLYRFQACFPGSKATALLQRFNPPVPQGAIAGPANCANLTTSFPASDPLEFDRHTALGRTDAVLNRNRRIAARIAVSRFAQPEFIRSLYPSLSSTLRVNSVNGAVQYAWNVRPHISSELRAAVRGAEQGWNRPSPETPSLFIQTDHYPYFVSAPGSAAAYSFGYRERSGEVSESLSFARGRNIWTIGGGALIHRSDSSLTFRKDGFYRFSSVAAFAADAPTALQISLNRLPAGAELSQPDYDRAYANQQFYAFAQVSHKVSRRLGINAGLRYDSFGTDRNTGAPDPYFSHEGGIAGARLLPADAAHRSLYAPDRNNWAPRIGLFYALSGDWRTVVRGAFGIFYDRPFQNLITSSRNNSLELFEIRNPAGYPNPASALVPGAVARPQGIPTALWIDPNLRSPYVQSWFAGLQRQFSTALYGEISAQGALARKLVSTDIVNRPSAGSGNPSGRLNAAIPADTFFRSNAGASSYSALTALVRHSGRRVLFQAAYTWSHSIDNQSDPLQGTFDDLGIARSTNVNRGFNTAAFMREFDSRLDRGSSDFDQRQNLVFFSLWRVGPRAAKGWLHMVAADWQLGQFAGFRSGFPYNLITGEALPACPVTTQVAIGGELERPRPTLLPGRQALLAKRIPARGGFQLVDPGAFCNPPVGVAGTLGRNALTGPGFWNVDLTIARTFRRLHWGESRSIQFRADWFNAFNHGNVDNPDGVANSSTFGVALIGRQGVQPSFPSSSPLDQLARQIQFQLKLVF